VTWEVIPLEVTFRKCGHKGMETTFNQQKSVLVTLDVETMDSGW